MNEMIRNPGFESAPVIIPTPEKCTQFVGKRIRVVGFVQKIEGRILTLKHGDCILIVQINEYYNNEHQHFQHIEVLGEVESVFENIVRINCFYLRGLDNFNLQLYQQAVRRKESFLAETFS